MGVEFAVLGIWYVVGVSRIDATDVAGVSRPDTRDVVGVLSFMIPDVDGVFRSRTF